MYDFYKAFYEEEHKWVSPDPAAPLLHRFAGANVRIPEDVLSILDVGCGKGEFLDNLPDRYFKIGVDLCIEPVRGMRAGGLAASIDFLPFGSRSFHLVSCFEVLEHLPHTVFPKALRELERVSDRYIILSVPNSEVLCQALVTCPRCFCAFNPARHVRSLNERALHCLFAEFRPVDIRACGPLAFRHDSKLIRLYRALVPRPSPAHAVCPQCGYAATVQGDHEAPTGASSTRRLRARSILYFLRRVAIRTHSMPYWLLATYKRT
jgi:SAM-dependent methyltransferase